MKKVLLVCDEEEDLLGPYQELGFPLAWVGHRQRYSEALRAHSELVLQDPGGDLAVLPELRARCAEKGLEPFFVSATSEGNLPYAVRWAEALGARGPCPPGALDFFYDKHEMRRRMGTHPMNVESWLASDLTGLSGGPFVLKPRQGHSSLGVRVCRDRAEVESEVAGLADPSAWVVERRIPGKEFVLDGYMFRGEFRLTGLHRTFMGGHVEGLERLQGVYANPYVETAFVSGPLFEEAQGLAFAEELGGLLRAQGLREGMFHSEFRMDGDQPKLVESHPRPGGGALPYMGQRIGCYNLIECFRWILREDEAPPQRYPSRWAYIRYTKGAGLGEEARAALARDCPDLEFMPWTPTSEGPSITQTNDWDLCFNTIAPTREALGLQMIRIEEALLGASA